MSILGGTPTTVREYSGQFAEALLLSWYTRFGLNPDAIPIAVCNILIQLEKETEGVDLSDPPGCSQPLTLAMRVADSKVREALLDGTPVTEERLEQLALELTLASIVFTSIRCRPSCTNCSI